MKAHAIIALLVALFVRIQKKLGVSELMPLFCELDKVMITLQHGILHRKQTIAKDGEYCDYYITRDKELLFNYNFLSIDLKNIK